MAYGFTATEQSDKRAAMRLEQQVDLSSFIAAALMGIVMKTRREMLEEFIAADPGDSFSRYALALELEKEGKELEAITHLQEVLARDPDYVAAYYHLGRMLARMGQVEDARAVYHRGIDAAEAAGDKKTSSEIKEAIDLLG